MNASDSLSTMILRSAGIYSDEVLEKIVVQRARNPGMGLAEAAVKFGWRYKRIRNMRSRCAGNVPVHRRLYIMPCSLYNEYKYTNLLRFDVILWTTRPKMV